MSDRLLGPMAWVLVYVDDLPAMRAFYEDGLGLEARDGNDRFVNFYTGGCTLELMRRADNGPDQPSEQRGWERNRMHVSFKVEDIESVVTALEGRGISPRHGIAATVVPAGMVSTGRLAQFEDPEGNYVEICDERLVP